MSNQPIDITIPTFETFFEYTAIIISNQGRNSNIAEEMADNWLIEQHLKLNIDDLTMRQVMQILKKLKSYKYELDTLNQDEFEYDGHHFKYIDQPGSLYKAIKKDISTDPKKGFYRAIINCYTCDNKPIKEVEEKLNFLHAGVLVNNFSSFF